MDDGVCPVSPFLPRGVFSSYPVPILCHACWMYVCVRGRQLVCLVHRSSDQEELYWSCCTSRNRPEKPLADAIKAGGLGGRESWEGVNIFSM